MKPSYARYVDSFNAVANVGGSFVQFEHVISVAPDDHTGLQTVTCEARGHKLEIEADRLLGRSYFSQYLLAEAETYLRSIRNRDPREDEVLALVNLCQSFV